MYNYNGIGSMAVLTVWLSLISKQTTMNIDLTSVIIGVLALSTFFVPIIYFEYFKKRSFKKFERHFMELAGQHNLTLTQYDIWKEKYAIGFDRKAGKIFYLKMEEGTDTTLLVSLSELKRCRVSKDDNKIKTSSGYTRNTTRIDLNLTMPNPDKPDLHLEFYRETDGTGLREELPLAEKWAALINSRLR